jgi:perosamine synthetase
MIFTSLTPNVQYNDLWQFFLALIRPAGWFTSSNRLAKHIQAMFHAPYTVSVDNARSALYLLLKSMGIKTGDEVILQAFTCVAVANPIVWTGAKPVWVDCDPDTYCATLESIKKAITPATKAIIVQHTFGIPADISAIVAYARSRDIYVIEDCAHTIGGRDVHGDLLGTKADASVMSFGRDKPLSCTSGGVAVVNNVRLIPDVQSIVSSLKVTPFAITVQNILHPFIMSFIKATYNTAKIGRFVFRVALYLRLLPRAITTLEKEGGKPAYMPSLLPLSLQRVALHQLNKLEKYNEHRKNISDIYQMHLSKLKNISLLDPKYLQSNPLIRFPLKIENANNLFTYMKRGGIELGKWYDHVIIPQDVHLQSINYTLGSCPNAEKLAISTLNLPVSINIQEADALYIISLITAYAKETKS